MGNHIGTGGFPAIEDAASGGEVQERFRGEPLEVAVKPLVWTDTGFAHTSTGMMYRIQEHEDGIFVLTTYEGSSETKTARATEDGAREAAQSDYEIRIRAALSQSPDNGAPRHE